MTGYRPQASAGAHSVQTIRWHRVKDETWSALTALAAERDLRSATASNTRPWNQNFNLLGLIGEAFYATLVSLPYNQSSEIRDGGVDFPGVDVKATAHWHEPRLLRLKTDPLKAPLYFLAAVNLPERRVRAVGYATREMLDNAPVVEYGYGPTRTLIEDDLLTADQVIPRLFHAAGRRAVTNEAGNKWRG